MKKKETYAELLRKPEWQKKRLEIMHRDNFTCQYCGSKENELQVHHRVYRKGAKPWEYDDFELITLCKNCHSLETLSKEVLYENFITIKENAYEIGLSDNFISHLLGIINETLFTLNINKCSEIDKKILLSIIDETNNINDAKALFSNGIKLTTEEQRNLQQGCPWMYDIYKEYSK